MFSRSNECVLAPSKPKEFSLYVHNIWNVEQGRGGGGSVVHGGSLVAAVNIKSATHDPCHLPTYQEEKKTHSRLCSRLNHQPFLFTARTEGQGRGCVNIHCWYAGRPTPSFPFFFFICSLLLLLCFKSIAIFHSLQVKCKHAPWIWIEIWKAQRF